MADLVLEGGGVKGSALVGAVAAFEAAGYRFNRVAGTSAGAIVASMVSSGIPSDVIHQHILAFDYARFRDRTPLEHAHLSGLGAALSELVDGGLYMGDALRDAIAAEPATRGHDLCGPPAEGPRARSRSTG